MGNIIDSLLTGFTKVIADILAKPLDFLSGKACSSVCGSTWDLICYIQNFCLANLAKMAAILFLLYLGIYTCLLRKLKFSNVTFSSTYAVLVFFYLIYKVGICSCVSNGICSCVSCSFSACNSGCKLVCNKTRSVRRARHKQQRRRSRHDVEDYYYSTSSAGSESEDDTQHRYTARSSHSQRSLSGRSAGNRRKVYLERSLRPRSHRVMVGVVTRRPVVVDKKEPRVVSHRGERPLRKIKVTRTSRFVHKGSGRRADYI